MAKPTQYTAIAPDGTQATRKSHRTYTHCVMVYSYGSWGAYGWCGRHDLAQKKAAEARSRSHIEQVHIAAPRTA